MYFNGNRKDTNIDSEFKENNNILSTILSFLNKYKLFIIIGIVLLIIIMIFLFTNRNSTSSTNKIFLELSGEEEISIYQSTDYIEPGYIAYNSKDEDLTKNVKITSNLNTNIIGSYEITYTLDDITKTRKINVIEKNEEYTYIKLNAVNKNVDIYLKLGEKYNEPGYIVFNSEGKDLNNLVKITGEVDTSKKGTYRLTYSLVDPNNVTISVTRNIIVMDSEISLSLNNKSYTNGNVTINIAVSDEYFDYMILPNNQKITKSTYSYSVSENGTYRVTVYNSKGMSKTARINVNNIDRTAPNGSCSGYFQLGTSNIKINANDISGINKYEINGKSYTTNNITFNNQIENVNIIIYDKAGNTKNINCNLEDKNTSITSNKNITFSYKYVNDNNMPYGLFTPSNGKYNKKTPLIISLHGSSKKGCSQQKFRNKFLVKMFNDEWNLEGFNAYILFPHLAGNAYSSSWANSTSAKKLFDLIDKLVKELNIDTNKIILQGHSLGGIGALYMASHKRACFSAVVPISGYPSSAKLENIKIPIRGYVGSSSAGEDKNSITYMRKIFNNKFGIENLFERNVSHDNIPKTAFTEDLNKDNKSDLIEWMLTQ